MCSRATAVAATKTAMDGDVPSVVNQWGNKDAGRRLTEVEIEFGKPNYIANVPGGSAVWLNKGPFLLVQLTDEKVPHGCPSPHFDFLYTSVCVDISNAEQLAVVLGMSKSLWYDQLTRRLFSRCHFMGANVVTLLMATDYLTGRLPESRINPCTYFNYIMSVANKPDNYCPALERLNQNLDALGCFARQRGAPCVNLMHPQWTEPNEACASVAQSPFKGESAKIKGPIGDVADRY